MGANQALLRRFLSLILSWTTLAYSMPAPAAWTLDVSEIFRLLTRTQSPLDPRDLEAYKSVQLNDSSRNIAVLSFLEERGLDRVASESMQAFYAQNPGIKERLSAKVTANEVNLFFAETVLLLELLKNRRDILLDNQFQHWRYAWERIDFRYLKKSDAEKWSRQLRALFANAVITAGPWRSDELIFADNFFAQRNEMNDRRWYRNFRNRLRQSLDSRGIVDPVIHGRQVGLAVGTAAFAFLPTMVTMFVTGSLLVGLGEQLNYSDQDILIKSAGVLFTAITVVGLGAAMEYGSFYIGATSPLQFVPFRSRISNMLRDGKLSCQKIISDLGVNREP